MQLLERMCCSFYLYPDICQQSRGTIWIKSGVACSRIEIFKDPNRVGLVVYSFSIFDTKIPHRNLHKLATPLFIQVRANNSILSKCTLPTD